MVGMLDEPFDAMCADISCGTVMSILSLTLEVGTTMVLGCFGSATLIGGNGFNGRLNVVLFIIVFTLDIGMVGRVIVLGRALLLDKVSLRHS